MQDFTFQSVFCNSNSTENTIIEILEYLEVKQFWQDFAKIFCMYDDIYMYMHFFMLDYLQSDISNSCTFTSIN